MSTLTGFFYDEKCFWHSTGLHAGILPVGGWVQPPSGSGHAESPETKRRMKNLMDISGLTQKLYTSEAHALHENDLLRIHPQSYLDELKKVSDTGGGMLGMEAPFGPGSYEIAKLSAGLAYKAVESVLKGKIKNAYALSRPPGHHCLPEQAMGFCFLANIPIAIEKARNELGLKKVVIVDWDVHHGNGTQHIYYDDPSVLTISIHQDKCFPPGYSGDADIGHGAGKGFNINIPMLAGSGHHSYEVAFDKIVIPAITRFSPELIIIACGYDANALDPLARMLLHSDSFRMMTHKIMAVAQQVCDERVVLVHEGGYCESYVPFCGLAVMETLSNIKTEVEDPLLSFIHLQQPNAQFENFQNDYLDRLSQSLGL